MRTRSVGKALLGALSILLCGQAAIPPTVAAEDRERDPYGHFFFVRHNEVGGAAKTDTLVHAEVLLDRFDLRDVCSRPNLHVAWSPLCVANGRLYAIKLGKLWRVDLEAGTAGELDSSLLSRESLSYGAHRLYAIVRSGETHHVRAYDFRNEVFRDITTPMSHTYPYPRIAVSPDHQHLAVIAATPRDPKKPGAPTFQLHTLNIATGALRPVGNPITYLHPAISSKLGGGPPFVWTDERTILFVQTKIPKGNVKGGAWVLNGTSNVLTTVDVNEGTTRDVAPIPGSTHFAMFSLHQERPGAPPFIRFSSWPRGVKHGRYRVDVANRKLLEDNRIGGDYRLDRQPRGTLRFGERTLHETKRGGLRASVSPDGRRVIWIGGHPARRLFYHGSAQNLVRVVADGWVAGGFMWFKEDGPVEPTAGAELSSDWRPFNDLPEPKARKPWVDTRKDIRRHLAFSVQTSRPAYALHEPIEITVTLRNIGATPLKLLRPVVKDGIFNRIVRFTLKYPRGSKSVDSGAQPYGPKEEAVTLNAGESNSATGALEVARPGRYTIEMEYKGFKMEGAQQQWKSRLKADPASFLVQRSGNEEELFSDKLERLLAKLRKELRDAPDWDGYNQTAMDNMLGLPGLGPRIVPRLITFFEEEEDARKANFRKHLYRTLVQLANPIAIPFYEQRLMEGESDEWEPVCQGLTEIYRRGRESEDALDVLLLAMDHPDAGARRIVVRHLARIDRPAVHQVMADAVDDDKDVRTRAARYLAAAEGLDLVKWLRRAATSPTRARRFAGRSIVRELEQHWHTQRGALPAEPLDATQAADRLKEFQRTLRAWATWAQENPGYSQRFFDADRAPWRQGGR